jgi:hypothetical protein
MRHARRAIVLAVAVFLMTAASAAGRPAAPLSTKRAEAVLAAREQARLGTFTHWLAAGHARGFVGEVGWPGNARSAGDDRWNAVARTWYRAAARARLTVAVWATGELWARSYKLSVYSANSPGGTVSEANPQSAVVEQQSAQLRGINVDGGAFGEYGTDYDPVAATSPLDNVNVGAYGSVYSYPSAPTFAYLAHRGIRFVRLAFRWERLQRQPGAALDPVELARIRASVNAAGQAGLRVILDCHNYGGYYARDGASGVRRALGSRGLPAATFAGLWRRLSVVFAHDRTVLGYGLMNEPTAMSGPHAWERASTAAVAAIRASGDRHRIFVSAYDWGSVTQFAAQHPRGPWIRDPVHNTWYEAHQYFDRDMSAHYRLSFDAEARAAAP